MDSGPLDLQSFQVNQHGARHGFADLVLGAHLRFCGTADSAGNDHITPYESQAPNLFFGINLDWLFYLLSVGGAARLYWPTIFLSLGLSALW